MSQLMGKLNSLNESRKVNGGVIIEEAQENQEPIKAVPEYKGIYFLSFLMVLLIGFSVLSLSISLKTFSQLEDSWADSKAILQTMNKQQKDIAELQSLIADGSTEELAQIEDLKGQINALMVSIQNRENEFSEMKVAYNNFKASTQESIEELKLSDELVLKKYILLNDKVQKFNEDNLFISNIY